MQDCPDSKVCGANMGATWVLSALDGPHVGPMNLAISVGRKLNKSMKLEAYITAPHNRNTFHPGLFKKTFFTHPPSRISSYKSACVLTGSKAQVWVPLCKPHSYYWLLNDLPTTALLLGLYSLTLWGLGKMANILQMTVSKAFFKTKFIIHSGFTEVCFWGSNWQ